MDNPHTNCTVYTFKAQLAMNEIKHDIKWSSAMYY